MNRRVGYPLVDNEAMTQALALQLFARMADSDRLVAALKHIGPSRADGSIPPADGSYTVGVTTPETGSACNGR